MNSPEDKGQREAVEHHWRQLVGDHPLPALDDFHRWTKKMDPAQPLSNDIHVALDRWLDLTVREVNRVVANKLQMDAGEKAVPFFGKPSPESIAGILKFFLPKKIRRNVFEPFVEELKEDRLLRKAASKSRCGSFFVEAFFYSRMTITFVQSLLLWLCSIVAKLSPLMKWIIGGGS